MSALPYVVTREQVAEFPLWEQLLNSECTNCQKLVVKDPLTTDYLVVHHLINKQCGHSVDCSEFDICKGCGTFFRVCNHCKQDLCSFCEQARLIAVNADMNRAATSAAVAS